jgi:hypothetical protein
MNRYAIQIPSPNAVTAGSTSYFDLPTDLRYHAIYLNYKGNANQSTIQSDITGVRLKVGNVTIREFTPAQLFLLNALRGQAFANGYLPIFFSEPWMIPAQREIYAWGMANIRTFQLEVDIAGGATSPTLGGFMEVDDVQENFEGVVSWYNNSVTVSSTGLKRFLPEIAKEREALKAIHLFEASDGDIDNLYVRLDNFEVFNLSAGENSELISRKGLTDQSAMISYAPDKEGKVESFLPLVKRNGALVSRFEMGANMVNAASFTYILEAFGNPVI